MTHGYLILQTLRIRIYARSLLKTRTAEAVGIADFSAHRA